MRQSIPALNNQISRVESDIRSLDSNKNRHEAAAAASTDDVRANAEHMMAQGLDSKVSTLEQEKQRLENEKAQIEQEVAAIDVRIRENEAEHKSLVDQKMALTG